MKCDYCKKPYTSHNLTTDEKMCLDHWNEWQEKNIKKFEEFKGLTGIKKTITANKSRNNMKEHSEYIEQFNNRRKEIKERTGKEKFTMGEYLEEIEKC